MHLQEYLREHNAAAAQASTAAAEAVSAAAEAAAAGGVQGDGQRSEPLSLWHEMQRRQQAEAAALEAEVSVGPGLQGPGGMLGEDLWMFDGGLFAEEGEQAGSQQCSVLAAVGMPWCSQQCLQQTGLPPYCHASGRGYLPPAKLLPASFEALRSTVWHALHTQFSRQCRGRAGIPC